MKYKEDLRKHLKRLKENIPQMDTVLVPNEQKKQWKAEISDLLYFLTHGHWNAEKLEYREIPPEGHLVNALLRGKGGSIGDLSDSIATKPLAGFTREHRRARDQIGGQLHKATRYQEPMPYYIGQDLPWFDPKNQHPQAIAWREERAKQEEARKKDVADRKRAAKEKEARKKDRLEKESKERAKEKKKTRKARKEHFEEQERLRSGKKA